MSTSKPVGLHVHSQLADDKVKGYILRVRPSVMKWLTEGMDDELVRLAKANGVLTIGRHYFEDQAIEGSQASAQLDRIRQEIRRHPNIMVWEGVNEAFQGGDDLAKRAAWDIKLMKVCDEEGVKAAIGSFSVGQPARLNDWAFYLPELRYAAEHGHYVALHEYGAPVMQWGVGENQARNLEDGRWTNFDPVNRAGLDGWFVLRYRKAVAKWRELGMYEVPRIVITEGGLDDIQPRPNVGKRRGYKTYRDTEWYRHPVFGDYADQWRWTCERWAEDDYLVGGVEFGFADASGDWGDFDMATDQWTYDRLVSEMIELREQAPAPPAPPPPPPVESRVLGIDVSRWQGRMDWGKAAKAGARFAFCKTSEGTSWVDPEWKRNAAGARAAGILVGGYHYYLNAYDPIQQARHFALTLLDQYQPGDLPPVADFEDTKTPAQVDQMRTFLQEVERLTGVWPIIYTGTWWWDSTRLPRRVDWAPEYPLWIASYRTGEPNIPDDWKDWDFHQYTSTGPGSKYGAQSQHIDLNWFNGGMAELRTFIRESSGDEDLTMAEALLTIEPELQAIQLNPDASLQRAITSAGPGWQVTGDEQPFSWGGSDYIVQRAENLSTGRVRVYHVPVGKWSDVSYVERPESK